MEKEGKDGNRGQDGQRRTGRKIGKSEKGRGGHTSAGCRGGHREG